MSSYENKNDLQNFKIHSRISPFKGRIVMEEKITVFGFSIPHRKTLCTIDRNGIVTSHDGHGWIDNNGQIHKGHKSNYRIDYQKDIVGIIKDNELYLKNIRVGRWESGR